MPFLDAGMRLILSGRTTSWRPADLGISSGLVGGLKLVVMGDMEGSLIVALDELSTFGLRDGTGRGGHFGYLGLDRATVRT